MKAKIQLKKVTVRLGSNQYQRLRQLYPNVGYNGILRALVDKHLEAVDRRINEKLAKQGMKDDIMLEGLDELLNIPATEGTTDGTQRNDHS